MDGAGREAVAADLLAGEGRLLQEEDVQAGAGEVAGGGGSGGSRADHDDIALHKCRLNQSAAWVVTSSSAPGSSKR